MNLIMAVTTYNRKKFFQEFISSWYETMNQKHNWILVVADDGSTDGTIEYIKNFQFKNKIIFENKRFGIANQTNIIFKHIENYDYDICFKSDDDMLFIKKGWDDLYIKAIVETKYQHLCYENPNFNLGDWCKNGVLDNPILLTINNNKFIARTKSLYTKGCFYTITKNIQNKVGFMDSYNFFHGYEHVDYTKRCARLGFNNLEFTFDCFDSNNFLSYRFPWNKDQPSLGSKEYLLNQNGWYSKYKKLKLIDNNSRSYIPYNISKRRMQSQFHGYLL